jgi:phosphatidylethanolamine/phosphatidyl-N-methylethanolamine N-methyltransferase
MKLDRLERQSAGPLALADVDDVRYVACVGRLLMARALESDGPADVVLDSSTPALTNNFIDGVYSKLSPVYDAVFGAVLQPGRIAAVAQMGKTPGTRVLEVGVGTGIGARLYPRSFEVLGIDLCADMLENARRRIVREGLHHITLERMDAANLAIDDNSFDVVYAPYVLSVVPDPVRVAREMRRVCRPGGRIVILNHFRSSSRIAAALERFISPVTIYLGFRSDLDLSALLANARLTRSWSPKVNVPPIWSLVTCVKG